MRWLACLLTALALGGCRPSTRVDLRMTERLVYAPESREAAVLFVESRSLRSGDIIDSAVIPWTGDDQSFGLVAFDGDIGRQAIILATVCRSAVGGSCQEEDVVGYGAERFWLEQTFAEVWVDLVPGSDLSVDRIVAGPRRTCALGEGLVRCWGMGELPAPLAELATLPPVTDVALGEQHSCALTVDARLFCWGDNSSGQVGDGTFENRDEPYELPLAGVTALAAGANHTCAIAAGVVHCWGQNDRSQVGDGTFEAQPTPRQVLSSNAWAISARGTTTCAVTEDETVWCWGEGEDGRLYGTTPTQAAHDAVGVSVGDSHACSVRRDGVAECWGSDGEGQLGNGPAHSGGSAPVVIDLDWDVAAVAAGPRHTCVLDVYGRAWCFGGNEAGQLGDLSFDARNLSPVPVAAPDVVFFEIAAGETHTCARTGAGRVHCWGDPGLSGDPLDQPGAYHARPVPILR